MKKDTKASSGVPLIDMNAIEGQKDNFSFMDHLVDPAQNEVSAPSYWNAIDRIDIEYLTSSFIEYWKPNEVRER